MYNSSYNYCTNSLQNKLGISLISNNQIVAGCILSKLGVSIKTISIILMFL